MAATAPPSRHNLHQLQSSPHQSLHEELIGPPARQTVQGAEHEPQRHLITTTRQEATLPLGPKPYTPSSLSPERKRKQEGGRKTEKGEGRRRVTVKKNICLQSQ